MEQSNLKRSMNFLTLMILFFGVFYCSLRFTYPDKYQINFIKVLEQPSGVTCGHTCAAMLLKHYGKGVELEKYYGSEKKLYPYNLCDLLNENGLQSKLIYGDLDRLKKIVSQDKPCIVVLRVDERMWHYVIVDGYEESSFSIIDPDGGRRYIMEKDKFYKCWSWSMDLNGKEYDHGSINDIKSSMGFNPFCIVFANL
jgi:ABC-type bacteriocin/lantibiotic exporter with double-glycine peptidase domain